MFNNEKIKNLIYIGLGFFLGQGAMFLSQTYVIYSGGLELVGSVGIGLGLVSFFQWIADMGGVFLIPKYASKSRVSLCGFLVGRVLFAVPLACLVLFCLEFLDLGSVVNGILECVVCVIFVGALNMTGLVDSVKKNKYVGPLSGLSWFFAAMALILFIEDGGNELGVIVGWSYFSGLLLSIILQFVVVRSELAAYFRQLVYVAFRDVVNGISEGFYYSLSFISNQAYGRLVPVMISKYLGLEVTGMFVYARHVVNMFGQIMMFSRRVEFESLLNFEFQEYTFHSLLRTQMISFFIGVLCFIFALVIYGLSFYVSLLSDFNQVSKIMIWLSGILMLFNFSSLYSQFFVAKGKMIENVSIQGFTVALALVALYFSIQDYGLYAVYVTDIFLHVARVLMFVGMLTFWGKINHG